MSAVFVAPNNPYSEQMLMWDIRHITTDTVVSLCSEFRLPTSSLAWSTLAGKMDVMAAKYNALDNKWDVVSFLPGYSF